MALIKIQGEQVPVTQAQPHSSQLLAPAILVRSSGRTEFRTLALKLAGVTGLYEERLKALVRQTAATVLNNEKWTSEEAQRVIVAVGSIPAPKALDVRRVKGQNMAIFRIPEAQTASTLEVKYPRKGSRASLNLRTLLSEEGIKIPRRMYMEIPVVLAEDDKGLVLAAHLRHGVLKAITEVTLEQEETAEG